jgi:DNA primase
MQTTILGGIYHLKKHKVKRVLNNIRKQLLETSIPDDEEILLSQYIHMKKVEKVIADYLGIVIVE